MTRIVPLEDDTLDATAVAQLTDLLAELVRGDAALGWVDPPGTEEIEQLLQSLLAHESGDAHAVVAFVEGEVAGFGYWIRYPRPTHRPHADLEKLAVGPRFGGQGLGRALLRELIAGARAAGIEQLTLDLRGDNTRAEKLYLSEGFREYGRLREFVAPGDGRRLDKVLHVLDLREAGERHA